VVVPAPELLSIDVAVKDKIGTIRAFRKGTSQPLRVVRLLRHFSHHRPSGGRRRRRKRLGRRFNPLNLFCGLSDVPDRAECDCYDKYGGCDDCSQNARD
jgi:hypothetical protein